MLSTLFWVLVGYAVAILFPVPVLSRAVLDGWAKLLGVYSRVRRKYVVDQTNTTP